MLHNLDHWPFVITTSSGVMTINELRDFFKLWNEWLDSGQSFVAIRNFIDEDALAHPEGGARET